MLLEQRAIRCTTAHGHVLGFRGTHHDDTERLAQDAKIRQLVRIHAVLSAFSTHVLRATTSPATCWTAPARSPSNRAASARPASASAAAATARLLDFVAATAIRRCCAASRAANRCPIRPGGALHDFPGAVRVARRRAWSVDPDFGKTPTCPPAVRGPAPQAGVACGSRAAARRRAVGRAVLLPASAQASTTKKSRCSQRLARDIAYACDFLEKSERLEFLAYHNPVTGLPNRAEFREACPRC